MTPDGRRERNTRAQNAIHFLMAEGFVPRGRLRNPKSAINAALFRATHSLLLSSWDFLHARPCQSLERWASAHESLVWFCERAHKGIWCGSPRRHLLFWMGTRRMGKEKLSHHFSPRKGIYGVGEKNFISTWELRMCHGQYRRQNKYIQGHQEMRELLLVDVKTMQIGAENETASHRHAQIIDETNTKMGNCKLATPACLWPRARWNMHSCYACTTSTFYINMSHCCIRRRWIIRGTCRCLSFFMHLCHWLYGPILIMQFISVTFRNLVLYKRIQKYMVLRRVLRKFRDILLMITVRTTSQIFSSLSKLVDT